jgi:Asp-tRNA(Asn)/Glu-tRNA(Gln) amidotransferase A subunit family amidase
MVALATGSDIGGSLRTPAAWCGVVGFRPTPGVVPNRRTVRGWSPMCVDGPLARSVSDVALMLSAMAGEDRQDPQSHPVDPAAFLTLPTVDLATRRVGFSEDLGFARVDPDIRHVFRERMAALTPAFRAAHTVDVGLTSAYETFTVLRGAYFLNLYGQMVEATPEKVGPLVTENTRYGATLSLTEVLAAEAEQTRLYRRFQALFDDIDLLICPAAAVSPFDKAEPYARVIDGVPAKTYMDWLAITFGLSLTACPIVCQPCGRDAAGMPFGIQVVGPRGADREVLGTALALEQTMAADPALARPVPDIRALALAVPDRVSP